MEAGVTEVTRICAQQFIKKKPHSYGTVQDKTKNIKLRKCINESEETYKCMNKIKKIFTLTVT